MATKPIQSTIFTTKSGAHKVRWRAKGRNWQKTFRRKVDALKFQSDLLKDHKVQHEKSNVKFEAFAEIWIERHCRINVEESTAMDYERALNNVLVPFFSGMNLSEIDEDDVIRFKEWLTLERGFAPVSVGNRLRLLKLVLNCACRWKDEKKRKYLIVNPAANVKEPKKIEPDFRFWTSDEIQKFLLHTRERAPMMYEIAALVTATGLRRGELFQLQRDCLDFENKLLIVKRSYSFCTRKVKPPKGRRIRRIPMNTEVYRLLYKYRDMDPTLRIYEGVNIEHFHKHLRKWCKAAEVSVVGLHDLRDTFASSLVKAGMKIKVIQYLMGHINVSTTEQYMHLDPNDVSASTDCLETGIDPWNSKDNLIELPVGSECKTSA